jgi:hypothetical protein
MTEAATTRGREDREALKCELAVEVLRSLQRNGRCSQKTP